LSDHGALATKISVTGGEGTAMSKISSLCVFCGSKAGVRPAYADAARRLGDIMAGRGVKLVYGGGRIGLMGVIADAVLEAGGHAVGVIPEFLKDLEVGNDAVTEQIVTTSMHERKNLMFELSDGFVALPGGLGTLDETLEITTWKQLRIHSKPIVALNTDGYWSVLEDLVRRAIDGGFAHPAVAELITVVATPEDGMGPEHGEDGWIEIGEPTDQLYYKKPQPVRSVQPLPGRLVMFPSFTFHRTKPFRSAGQRISIAFDVFAQP